MSLTVGRTDPGLSEEAATELRAALATLEHGPGLPERIFRVVSSGISTSLGRAAGSFGLAHWAMRRLPGLEAVATTALARAFDIAILGVPDGVQSAGGSGLRSSGTLSRLVVVASGAFGGAAGVVGFAPDVAVTTLAIMRRIGRIAQEEGEDLSSEAARRACLEVFALRAGAPGALVEGGYYETRLLLQGGPLLRLLAEIGPRYGLQLGQKLAAQVVPVAGAVCGAVINAAFMTNYDHLARAHFTVRRLERVWGTVAVKSTV